MNPTRPSYRFDYAALLLITACGLLLRAIGLNTDLWSDEVATLWISHLPAWQLAFQPHDETPFLYYALHNLLLPHADTPAEVRLLSFAFGVIAIPAMYFGARATFGRSTALIASMLLAFWPLHVQYSQEARAHALLFLLVMLSLLSLCSWLERTRQPVGSHGRRRALLGFGIVTVLSFYTHLLSLFWIAIAVPMVLVAAFRSIEGGARREAILCLALMALAALPGIHWLWLRLSEGHGYHWLEQATPLQAGSILVGSILPPLQFAIREAVLGDYGTRPAVLVAMFVLLSAALVLMLPAVPGVVRSLSERRLTATLLAALAAMPLVLWLVGFLYLPLVRFTNIVWAGSGPILLWALGLASIRGGLRRTAALIVSLALLLLTVAQIGVTQPRSNWTLASQAAAKLIGSGDVVVFCPEWGYLSFRFAAGSPLEGPVLAIAEDGARLKHFGAPEPGPSNKGIAANALRGRRVWLIRETNTCSDSDIAAAARAAGVTGWSLHWKHERLELLVAQ